METRLRQRSSQTASPSTSTRRYQQQDVSLKGKSKPRLMEEPSSFVEFLSMVAGWVLFPVTYPVGRLFAVLTSPLTISLSLRAILLIILLLSSGLMSMVAVGTFWWSWAGGGTVEVEGWLIYGSKSNPIPHSTIPLPYSLFPSDVRYDVEIELDLTRPTYRREGHDETGNFMISLDLLSEKTNDPVISVSQPCLLALPASPTSWLLHLLPTLPSPSYLFTMPLSVLSARSRHPRHLPPSPAVLRLTRPMLTGVVVRGGDNDVGAVKVLVGREDGTGREVGTGGWVVVKFSPRPTGLRQVLRRKPPLTFHAKADSKWSRYNFRWLLTIHPAVPLLILPPLALILTVSSSLIAYLIITCCFRSKSEPSSGQSRRNTTRGEKKSETWSSSSSSSPIARKGSIHNIPQVILHHPTPPLSGRARLVQALSSAGDSDDSAPMGSRRAAAVPDSEVETGDETETPAVSLRDSGDETETGSGGRTKSGTGSTVTSDGESVS